MAVHCGVCGSRLSDASENEGSFQVTGKFLGWYTDTGKIDAQINNSCEDCARILRGVITEAANKIVESHSKTVDALRSDLHAGRELQAKRARDKAQFEREWEARQPTKPESTIATDVAARVLGCSVDDLIGLADKLGVTNGHWRAGDLLAARRALP